MDKRLEYFSKTFPKIWEEVKDKLIEKDGVFLIEGERDGYPTKLLILYPALSEDEVASLESKLGVVLPEEYKTFLLNHNGCDFFDSLFIYGMKKTYNKAEFIEQGWVLAENNLGKDNEPIDEDEVGAIDIASDGGEVRYLLNINTGKVFAKDFEFPDKDEEYDSFNDFVKSIYEDTKDSFYWEPSD